MLEHDYIQQMIKQFTLAVAGALREVILDQQIDRSLGAEEAVADLMNLSADAAMSLEPASFVTMMQLTGIGDEIAGYVAYTLDRLADAYEDAGDDDLATQRRAQAEAVAGAFGWDLCNVPAELADLDEELYG